MLRSISIGAVAALVLVLAIAPSAVSADVPRTVNVAGVVSGPSGTVDLQARAAGGDGLEGTGVGFHREFSSRASFVLQGSVTGSVVTLSGTVSKARFGCLVGTPVTVRADGSTGSIVHSLGPIGCPGPLAGQTLAFVGQGTVVVNG